MATLFDITLLSGAKVIFTFLLLYVLLWGLFAWIKPFGKDVGLGVYAIISLVLAFFGVISGTVRYVIEFITPWLLFLILLIFFIIFILRLFGLGESSIVEIIKNPTVYSILLTAILIMLLFALGSAFGQKSLEATQGRTGGGVFYNGEGAFSSSTQVETNTTVQTNTQVEPLEPGADLNSPAEGGNQPQPGQVGSTNTDSFSLNLINTLLHPKVMALMALILIATVTVWLMARSELR